MKGATPGKRITRIRVATSKAGKTHWYQYVVRYASVAAVFCGIPFLLAQDWNPIRRMNIQVRLVFWGAVAGMYLFYLVFAGIMEIMHKPLFYEKLSGTKIISTIVAEEVEEEEEEDLKSEDADETKESSEVGDVSDLDCRG